MAKRANPRSSRKPPPRPKKRQPALPGLDAPSIPELDRAAERYVSTRDQRMAFTEDEVKHKQALADVMKARGLEVYAYEDTDGIRRIVRLEIDQKISVKKAKPPRETAPAGDQD